MSERKYRQIRTARANDVPGTIKRTLSYITRHHAYRIYLVVLGVILSSLTGVASSYFFTPVINNYIVPYIGSDNPELGGFVTMLIGMAVIYVVGVLSSYGYRKLVSLITTDMLHDLRTDLFNKMQKMPVKFFDSKTHGEIMILYTNDIDLMRPMVGETMPALLTTLITLIGCFGMMFITNIKLTLVSLLTLVIVVYMTFFLANNSRKYFKQLQKCTSNVNGYVEEMFSGQKVIKVFNHEEKAYEEMVQLSDELCEMSYRSNFYSSLLFPVNANISYVGFALTAALGAILCLNGELTIGALASFLLYVRQFGGPLSNLSMQFNGFMMSLAGAERVFALMDGEDELDEGKISLVSVKKENDGLVETAEKTGLWAWKKEDGELVEMKGDIKLNNVTFSYDGKRTILKNISLFANSGNKIAFVGSTGAGKTTITSLLNRFYDVEEGEITFDGIPMKEISKDSLRGSIGVVLQDTNLFSGTVMDNIRYGRLDATDEECIAAARRCNASSFIERLPDGYQTMLTSNGTNLSQGQRQLLNIARCAVMDPPVMIMDEATSSIDTHTEKLIEKGMDELMKGRTVFVIAHRLSTVRNSDCIIVLEQGEIVERGTHEQLIANKNRYYQLYTGKAELD